MDMSACFPNHPQIDNKPTSRKLSKRFSFTAETESQSGLECKISQLTLYLFSLLVLVTPCPSDSTFYNYFIDNSCTVSTSSLPPCPMFSGIVFLHPFPIACARVHECCASENHSGIRGDIVDVSGRTIHTGVRLLHTLTLHIIEISSLLSIFWLMWF